MAYNRTSEIRYEIVKETGVTGEQPGGRRKELNLVSRNGGNPEYDIRERAPGHEKMGKGVALTEEEMQKLKEATAQEIN